MARIELNYNGDSTRGASTSAAAMAGLSADLFLEAADWAFVQTFDRFYHRESSAGSFARAVLNGLIYQITKYLFVMQFTGGFVLL